LEHQFKDEISNNMKIAVFTNRLPSTLQDYIYTHAEKDTLYGELKEKVRAMTSNKLASTKPTPMDVGQVGEEAWPWDDGNLYDTITQDDEQQIDAVSGHLQCRNCHGYGHFARECPSQAKGAKGKGKGQANTGKGYQNGKGSNAWPAKGGKNGKGGKGGKGKSGFTGTCFSCGQVGHRAADCMTAAPMNNVETHPDESIDIGGCWVIGAVDADEGQGQADERPLRTSRYPPGHHKRSQEKPKEIAAQGTGIQNIDRPDSNSCKKITEKNPKDALDVRG
jgi:hypothetical protein